VLEGLAGSQQFARGMIEQMPAIGTNVLWRRAPHTVCNARQESHDTAAAGTCGVSGCCHAGHPTATHALSGRHSKLYAGSTVSGQDRQGAVATPTCPAPPIFMDSRTICTSP
jgi:hypothetical protein